MNVNVVEATNMLSPEIRNHIKKESDRYTKEFGVLIDPDIIESKIFAESSDGKLLTSGKGAKGYLQLMPETFRSLGFKNINDPYENISAGIKYYAQQKKEFKRDDYALAAYNAGPTQSRPYLKKGQLPPIKETQNHVKKVLMLTRQKKLLAQQETQDMLKGIGSNLPKEKKLNLPAEASEQVYPSGF